MRRGLLHLRQSASIKRKNIRRRAELVFTDVARCNEVNSAPVGNRYALLTGTPHCEVCSQSMSSTGGNGRLI